MSDEDDVGDVIYARVSSNKEVEEEKSLEAQIDQMRLIAKRQEVEFVRVPIRDEESFKGGDENDG